jgi:RNA polymerase sigma-70 factor (ECF subfamily)
MADFDERALIERCRRGDDDEAFGDLVAQYKDLVYGMIWRLAPDRTRVDDLAQEVFLKVHRGLPYFRGEARLSTWIYRIVANVCAEARTRPVREVPLERGPERPPIDPPSIDSSFADLELRDRLEKAIAIDPPSIDSSFADLELRDRLEKAIARLPEQYRFLIAAHHLQGVQYEALAEALGVPLGTVKTHLHRAKRRLRELLSDS